MHNVYFIGGIKRFERWEFIHKLVCKDIPIHGTNFKFGTGYYNTYLLYKNEWAQVTR